ARRARAPVHGRAAGVDPAPGPAATHPADRHRGSAPQPARDAAGLPVRPTLPARDRHLPERGSTVGGDAHHGAPPGRLPPPVDPRTLQHQRGLMTGSITTDDITSGPAGADPAGDATLVVDSVTVEYTTRTGPVHAVTGVALEVPRGSTLALVGESGCGKSSLGRAMLQLPRPTSGSVRVDDTDLCTLSGAQLKHARKMIQMVFQDPISSLNPRRTVRDIVAEGLEIQG